MPKYGLDPAAEQELKDIWAYVAKRNSDAADRLVRAAYQTFQTLAEIPFAGKKRDFSHSRLRDLRSFRISGFDHYHIFYRITGPGIYIVHIYHDARDLEVLFKE